ncbi:MAG: GPW/gp25 family protein [Myxococcales bacterium]|nr:GPW/gp25 family protein [Myxococcales bacterium]
MATKHFLGRGLKFPMQVNSTGGMAMSEAADNIEESIRCIIGTAVGERVMRPLFGCRVHDFVFHPNSASTQGLVSFYVREALQKYEPRIGNIIVNAAEDPARANVMLIDVRYTIRSTNVDHNMVYPFYLRREQDL